MDAKLKQAIIAHAISDIRGLLQEKMDDIYASMLDMKINSDPEKKFTYAIGAKITLSPHGDCVKQHASVTYGMRKKVETEDIFIDPSQITMDLTD